MQLAQAIGLDYIPTRIECYDNSHLFGRDMVGAMIVFTNDSPTRVSPLQNKNAGGRRRLLAMREVLTRRFERALRTTRNSLNCPT